MFIKEDNFNDLSIRLIIFDLWGDLFKHPPSYITALPHYNHLRLKEHD